MTDELLVAEISRVRKVTLDTQPQPEDDHGEQAEEGMAHP